MSVTAVILVILFCFTVDRAEDGVLATGVALVICYNMRPNYGVLFAAAFHPYRRVGHPELIAGSGHPERGPAWCRRGQRMESGFRVHYVETNIWCMHWGE